MNSQKSKLFLALQLVYSVKFVMLVSQLGGQITSEKTSLTVELGYFASKPYRWDSLS